MRKSRCSFFKRDVKKTSCVAFPAYPVAFFCFQLNNVEIFSPRCWWLIVLNGSQWLKRCIILTFMCGMKEVKWSRWASHSVQIHNWSHLQRLCSGSKMLYIPVLQRFLSNILRVTCIVSVFTRAFRQWQVRYFMVYITVLYHAIENTMANHINVMYVRCRMGRLDVIPWNIQWISCVLIGCIFVACYKAQYST